MLNMDGPTIEIVRRPDRAKGFVVIAMARIARSAQSLSISRMPFSS